MGSSKSFRGGPGYEPRNTPGANPKVSKGAIVKPEGNSMGSNTMRKGMRSAARSKSKSGKSPAKNSGPHGYS